ncbi:hypothetical protein C2S53_002145 [Perilla frutescens var. hirtella]|uniref:Uncharacterized protein n=1 Tax=Perilla frutescens var. hirtella TaxID=608512 RepID=A0AAD4JMZ6_PERFH|nr:hypothetical protein C2S53_002145 [Perilla frutescens var. hirtella]
MAKAEEERCVFPLTSLQIGDLQSYLSHRHLFLASESGNFYILVDNRPWLKDLASLSTHWWQLMVTKSRLSPFANTRGKKERKMTGELSESQASSSPYTRKLRKLREWFSVIDVVLVSRKAALLPVKKLTNSLIANIMIHRTLYGFIVFEVAWSNIRGINYYNELQTDTSLAIEAKIMRRWEFDSIAQAIRSISSWFPGTMKEQVILKEHLDATLGHTPGVCTETTGIIKNREHTIPTTDGPCQRKEVEHEHKICSGEANNEPVEVCSKTSDSYPGFCRLYRPWICPLARGLYVLISVITVLIGFYDLYKNVPLLKATVSKMFGPLFDYIDAWEMTSRIQYLGTMLFLHNFQKAMRWFLTATRTILSIISFFFAPMAQPFLELLELFFPLWNMFLPVVQDFFSVIWTVVESSFTMIGDILEIFLLPLWYIVTVAYNLATSFVYHVVWILLYAPFRLLLGVFSIVSSSCTMAYVLFRDVWMSSRSIFRMTKGVHSTVSTVEISMWRSLWHDLFSQVFRALRVILNGLVAFLAACNRHRLSIYNHAEEFTQRSLRALWRTRREEKARGRCTRNSTLWHLSQDSKDGVRPWKESHRVRKSKKAI